MAEVVSLRIKYGTKELELSLSEANELLECLKSALGRNTTWIWPSCPSVPYWQPYAIETPKFTVTYKGVTHVR